MERRVAITIRGAVQGVGFRPFVFRLAGELALRGWVNNDGRGVAIEAEGPAASLERFIERLRGDRPPQSVIESLETTYLEPAGFGAFEIRPSDGGGEKSAAVLPDLATCADCRREIADAADRRSGYPFTNCTHCGPRFSIVRALPYDRPNTTMAGFALCERCRAEYEDPRDRRFHAQPTACADCGPRVTPWRPSTLRLRRDAQGARGVPVHPERRAQPVVEGRPLFAAADALCAGLIVALKGLGGFHLLVDARSSPAVLRLRERKSRWAKPLAVMVRDLAAARALCEVSDPAAVLLESAQAPIVLLRRRADATIAPEVAPGTPDLGVMLAYTPLHHLLLARLDFPVVATSGNLTDEPICTDEHEALSRLGGIADLFLVHDRPIERHVDDSVAYLFRGQPRLLRRARGYAPMPVRLARDVPPVLAVGAHLKSVIALARGRQVFLSQHIGDLETPEALSAFERVIADFLRLYEIEPIAIAHDLHPDLASTRWAQQHGRARLMPVQHHHAHFASCLAENGGDGPALGVTWDGTGLGTDGVIWGGEFLAGGLAEVRRAATFRAFRLPGGEAAIREPRRIALALLWDLHGPAALERENLAAVRDFSQDERRTLGKMLESALNSPLTTSAGRLFDGIAALLGLHPRASFDGQAAMALEHLADPAERGAYPLPLCAGPTPFLDWRPLVEAVLEDLGRSAAPGLISARFHNALAEGIVSVARTVGEARVALTGGCFQNRLLTERAADRLEAAGFEVLLHRQVPPNDGGLSLGQAVVAAARL